LAFGRLQVYISLLGVAKLTLEVVQETEAPSGNLTADGPGYGTHTYQWDGEGRLKSVDGGSTLTNTYNAMGQRAIKNVGGTDFGYIYDVFGQVVYTMQGTSVLADYFPAPGFNFAKREQSEARFMHRNALGSVGFVTNHSGAAIQDELYLPLGQRWSVVGSVATEQFAAMQPRDSETVDWQDPLDPTPNRMYTSGLGRWLSPDPTAGNVLNPQPLNRYAYVMNNPINMVDPSGLDGEPCGADWCPPECFDLAQFCFPVPPPIGPIIGSIGGGVWHRPHRANFPAAGGATSSFISEADIRSIEETTPFIIRVLVVCAETPGCQAAAAAAAGGYIIYENPKLIPGLLGPAALLGTIIGEQIYQAKGTTGVGHNYIRDQARELAKKLRIPYCEALQRLYAAARAAGNFKMAEDTKATQKEDGCRGH
jgi:RHS repeat-associated protein